MNYISSGGKNPLLNYTEWSGGAGSATNDVIYTSGDVKQYNTLKIHNNSSAIVDVEVSLDGTNFVADQAAMRNIGDTAMDTYKVVCSAGSCCVLSGKWAKVRVLQSGAGTINAGEVYGCHTWE